MGIVNVSNTTHTNAGTMPPTTGLQWHGQLQQIGNTTITDCIDKATATVVVSAYT